MAWSAQELALLIAALVGAGVLAGLLAGLLGVGGGIVLVPVLYALFGRVGVDPALCIHLAVGTSLSTVCVTALRSARSHAELGALDPGLLRAWAPWIALGAIAGAALASQLESNALLWLFGGIAFGVSVQMGFGRETERAPADPPQGILRGLSAAGLGFVSVMMGLGGGTLGVPLLSSLGVPVHRAVGTAAGFGVWIALPGVIGMALAGLEVPGRPPFSVGYVNALGFALIVPATWLAAPVGARWAHNSSRTALRRWFALFLALTSLRMLLSAAR